MREVDHCQGLSLTGLWCAVVDFSWRAGGELLGGGPAVVLRPPDFFEVAKVDG
jgi:hypothetical protein